MNEEESDDVVLLEQQVFDADDLVEAELALGDQIEPFDDDYQPAEEVILLDTLRLDDDDLLDVA